jgi:hypothetical protein
MISAPALRRLLLRGRQQAYVNDAAMPMSGWGFNQIPAAAPKVA